MSPQETINSWELRTVYFTICMIWITFYDRTWGPYYRVSIVFALSTIYYDQGWEQCTTRKWSLHFQKGQIYFAKDRCLCKGPSIQRWGCILFGEEFSLKTVYFESWPVKIQNLHLFSRIVYFTRDTTISDARTTQWQLCTTYDQVRKKVFTGTRYERYMNLKSTRSSLCKNVLGSHGYSTVVWL